MSKDLWLAEHERLVAEEMEAYPDMTWTEAYERTAPRVDASLRDRLADMADFAKDRAKEGK